MKQFISVRDVADINVLTDLALNYKADPFKDASLGKNKKIGLIFLNPSLRTRISTQVAAQNLGMETIVFNIDKEGWALEFAEGAIMNGSTVEHIRDAAPVLGAYFDILCIRTFPSLQNREEDYSEMVISQFIEHCKIPVVSLESATLHPLQSLTDIITIKETYHNNYHNNKKKPKIVLTWAPHIKALPQCVANSFSQWVNAWGEAEFVITHPEGYALSEEFTKGAQIVSDQALALENADYVYVKNWSAFNDYGSMPPVFENWMLNEEKLKKSPDAKVMHCLPVRRNIELSDEILDGPNSIVTQQASNRVWAAQAVLSQILNQH
jgi:N-succinyl-L-ornithine transcarbamylase